MIQPSIIQGGDFRDIRGVIRFANDFDMSHVKRMYIIEHLDISTIRAWQAHKNEQKWFFVLEGKFEVQTVELDDLINPSKKLKVQVWEMAALENKILHIPGGFANGFRALKKNSKLLVFSNFDIVQSATDDFRFEQDYWESW